MAAEQGGGVGRWKQEDVVTFVGWQDEEAINGEQDVDEAGCEDVETKAKDDKE